MPERKAPRRRLSPADRRSELLRLGSEIFAEHPYDAVRIDEVAERAGVSRALMYHYFPDKRAFFAEVVRSQAEQLFAATDTPAVAGQTLFDRVRAGVLAYLRYHEQHPHESLAAHVGLGRSDPMLRWADEADNVRQMQRIMDAVGEVCADLEATVERDLRALVYGWLAFTLEMCRQRLIDPSLDADHLADTCAHTLLDAIGRLTDVPAVLADAVAPQLRGDVNPRRRTGC